MPTVFVVSSGLGAYVLLTMLCWLMKPLFVVLEGRVYRKHEDRWGGEGEETEAHLLLQYT